MQRKMSLYTDIYHHAENQVKSSKYPNHSDLLSKHDVFLLYMKVTQVRFYLNTID